MVVREPEPDNSGVLAIGILIGGLFAVWAMSKVWPFPGNRETVTPTLEVVEGGPEKEAKTDV